MSAYSTECIPPNLFAHSFHAIFMAMSLHLKLMVCNDAHDTLSLSLSFPFSDYNR